jgi:hypothetical protein
MTDRFNALTVVLERDIRKDDADALIGAIRQLRGVLSVEGNVADIAAHVAEERARHDIGQKLMDVLHPARSTR